VCGVAYASFGRGCCYQKQKSNGTMPTMTPFIALYEGFNWLLSQMEWQNNAGTLSAERTA